jgi:UDP-N-acetylmuramoyl-L-alanyl-D-glutamate--2,6-diaminopimelate ligase
MAARANLSAVRMGARPMERFGEFSGLASDSREVRRGYLFAALAGTHADGASFIADAVHRGAVAVLGRPPERAQTEALGVRFIADENPRRALARLAARFYAAQPGVVAAITGTNGKTSVAVFLRQIWENLGRQAASMGTIGIVAPAGQKTLSHTTPDAITLHRELAALAGDGVDHLALEASSHGLDQFRLDGVRIAAAGFTNLTRDHLDYHPDFSHYLSSKLRLFQYLVEDGGVAVVNADAQHAEDFLGVARARALNLLTVGKRGKSLRLVSRTPARDSQLLEIDGNGRRHHVALPLVGDFQAANALLAAGLAIGLGDPTDRVLGALASLRGAPGRMEKVAQARHGAPIYVDYAHTPDALETVLAALRPHVEGKLGVVFGCGGDRDKGKRRLMGSIAARMADFAIVTDDNPRSEDAGEIRRQVLAGCPGATEIGDRAKAIDAAVAVLEAGDALVIAGKGHESGQIVGRETRPFLDSEEALKAALAHGGRAAGAAP